MSKPTVVFDFDGVIHSYTSGWRGVNVAWDPPVPGIDKVIQDLRESGYRVVVLSARCNQPGGVKTIENYLNRHNITVDAVVTSKPSAVVTVDDRAICFNPKEIHTLTARIKNFKSWIGVD